MKLALCLPGGGAMGAMFQIGALAALEDSLEGFEVNRFDCFMGSSAGASVCAAVCGGLPVQRIYRAFLDPADVYFGLERQHLLRVDVAEWRRTVLSGASALRHGISSLFSGKNGPLPAQVREELDRLYDSLPAGLFTLETYEHFLESFFVRRNVPNSFSAMPRDLYVMAHDLDSGEAKAFGPSARVSVTRACIASMAVPPLFSPVRIGDRHYVNAGGAQAELLDLAVREGADVLFVVNAMSAVRVSGVPTGHGERDSLRDKGMMWVLNQAMRIANQRSVHEAVTRVRDSGRAEVMLIEPNQDDGILFMYNPASYDARRKVLEYAYRHTRALLARAFAAGHPALARAQLTPRPSPSFPPSRA